jgi:predicted enzyme related to lactoylglutathione lyase
MIQIEMVTFDARSPRSLAEWWARQTGGEVQGGFEGDEFVMVAPGGGGPRLGFQRVAEPTPGKNRVHLDLTAADREVEVERLLAEGALEVARHETSGFSWLVLADPEGNQFCVSQH